MNVVCYNRSRLQLDTFRGSMLVGFKRYHRLKSCFLLIRRWMCAGFDGKRCHRLQFRTVAAHYRPPTSGQFASTYVITCSVAGKTAELREGFVFLAQSSLAKVVQTNSWN